MTNLDIFNYLISNRIFLKQFNDKELKHLYKYFKRLYKTRKYWRL